jgi:predicted methyltransferase
MEMRYTRRFAVVAAVLGGFWATSATVARAADTSVDEALKAAIADSSRTGENVPRDVYRHPYQTLTFWGLKPGLKVIEIEPGGGYWTEILAPYAKATGGQYGTTIPDLSNPKIPAAARKYVTDFKARFAAEDKFGKVQWIAMSSEESPLGPPGSADMVITARNIHDWMWTQGQLEKVLAGFYAVLKPGGILAVEDHRADPRPQVIDAHDGYVNTKFLVDAVEKAGFKLEAASEINANPKDTKDYPFGVWTLPPTNARKAPGYMETWPGRPADSTLLEPAKYQAIGESDRMTLRFRKP